MTGQGVFAAAGRSSRSIAGLGWMLNLTAAAVVAVMCVVLLVALFRRRTGEARLSELGEASARRWIVIGTLLTIVILAGSFGYTVRVLRDSAALSTRPALSIRIVGYRYWWQVDYLRPDGTVDFVTANEIHLPVGVPVRLLLDAGDVIHSFWVPALAGKTDLIPGQTNRMWIEADTAGRYLGQCAEYCGTSHANMRIVVLAQAPTEFSAWQARQRLPAAPASDRDRATFRNRGCAACHTIRGTGAAGDAGPDLTHVASRTTLASGIIPNTPAMLARWLSAPDSVKPGALMPTTGLTPQELTAMTAYLRSLQ